MLTGEEVEQFQRDGFVNGGEVLDEGAVDRLRAELERVMEERDREAVTQPVSLRNLNGKNLDRPVWQIVNIWEASGAYRELVGNAKMTGAIAQLTGAHQLRVWHDQIQYKPAATGGVNMWHQDSPKWGILQPKTAQVSAWVALDDVDESNGCMSMVPGSHRWGDQDRYLGSLEGFDRMVAEDPTGHRVQVRVCPVKKGHVHFHHALTWHGSGANTSARPRRAIAVHYMTEETIYDPEGKHIMEAFVSVNGGARLEGDHFPLVWESGRGG